MRQKKHLVVLALISVLIIYVAATFFVSTLLFLSLSLIRMRVLSTKSTRVISPVFPSDFELEVADLKASEIWVNKFKSLNDDLEKFARQLAEFASKKEWSEMKKLQPEGQLTVKICNELPVTYHTLHRVHCTAVISMFGSMYASEHSFSHL